MNGRLLAGFGLFALLAAAMLPQAFAVGCGTTPTPSILSCIPVNIVNTQSTATPSGFQIAFNALPFNAIAGNVLVYNGTSGKTLPAWAESNSLIWVNLGANTIAGSSSANGIYYFGFGASGTNFFISGSNIGEAPQLSPTYAEYDNGKSVFSYYQAWGGLSALPSGWTAVGTDNLIFGADTTSFGTTSGSTYGGAYNAVVPSMSTFPTVIDIYANFYSVSQTQQGTYTCDSYGTTGANSCSSYADYAWTQGSGGSYLFADGGTSTHLISSPLTNANIIYTQQINSATSVSWFLNYSLALANYAVTASTPIYYALLGADTTYPLQVYWLRTRAYPPNGVMPSISYGAVQYPGAAISISPNTASYGQSVVITATCYPSTDSCAVDSPLGTHLATGTGTATYTIASANILGTSASYYAHDLTSGSTSVTTYLTYVPVNALNITAGTGTLSTKAVTYSLSPYTWNTYYPNEISITSPSNTLNYTLAQNFDANALQYITTNVASIAYIPPSNQLTGNYVYTIIERQSNNPQHVNLTIAANVTNMTVLNCQPAIQGTNTNLQYFPIPVNGLPHGCWNSIPSYYLQDTYRNSTTPSANTVITRGSNTLSLIDNIKSVYNQFSPSYSFNLTANTGLAANAFTLLSSGFCAAPACASPYTRNVFGINTFDGQFFTPLNSITAASFVATLNNWTISYSHNIAANNSNVLWFTSANFQNPVMCINNLTFSTSAAQHTTAINSYLPLCQSSSQARAFNIYLNNVNSSLVQINIYTSTGGAYAGYGDTMLVYTGTTVSQSLIDTLHITSVPVYIYLGTQQQYMFSIVSPSSQIIKTTPLQFVNYQNPVNIYLPSNNIVPPVPLISANASCVSKPALSGNYMDAVCSGVDLHNSVTSWAVSVSRVTSFLNTSYLLATYVNTNSSFNYNYSMTNSSWEYNVQITACSHAYCAVLFDHDFQQNQPVPYGIFGAILGVFFVLLAITGGYETPETAIAAVILALFILNAIGIMNMPWQVFVGISLAGAVVDWRVISKGDKPTP